MAQVTNSDHIRNISDEDLAKSLITYRDDWGDYVTHAGVFYDREEAIKAEIAWLNQPYEEA